MRSFRILFTLIAVLFIAGTTAAQSDKMMKKAEKKVTELNEQLTAIDASLALTADQIKQAQEVYATAFSDMKMAKKATPSKEEGKEVSKPIRKAMNKKIRKEVLSKEQRQALSKASKDK